MAEAPSPKKIFISYRPQETAGDAGRIYDRLVARFGHEAVETSADSIPAGVDFYQHFDSLIQQCGAVIAIMGPSWATAANESGTARLENPSDLTRIELESALRHEVPVIPILVNGALMPPADYLPPSLQPLVRLNAIEISYERFDHDVNRLMDALERYVVSTSTPDIPQRSAEHLSTEADSRTQTDKGEFVVSWGGHEFLFQAPEKFTGRQNEFRLLDSASQNARLVAIHGPAGMGKTALVSAWFHIFLDYQNMQSAFAWSFTHNQSVQAFFNDAIQFFGDKPSTRSVAPAALGVQLAQILISRRALLVLDGLETLQEESESEAPARVIDESLATLLVTLAVRNAGLCVITSRKRIAGLDDLPLSAVSELNLTRLPTEAGVDLLKRTGIQGTDKEFVRMVETYDGNPGMLLTVADHLLSGKISDLPNLKEFEEIADQAAQTAADLAAPAAKPPKPLFKPTFASFESDLVAFDPAALRKPLVDALGVGVYAGHLAQLIAARETPLPLSIGLFGDWGSGKSYFLRLLHQQVDGLTTNSSNAFCRKIVQIHFNAWHYLDTNLWANLVCEIFDQLFSSLTDRPDTSDALVESLKKKLGEKSALAAEAREALRAARKASKVAAKNLRAREAVREQRESTVAGFINDLSQVLDKNPELHAELRNVSSAFGLNQVDKSFGELEARAIEARTLGGRVKAMMLALSADPKRWRQIALLILAIALPIAFGFAVTRLLQLNNSDVSGVVRAITQIAALIGSVTAWFSVQIKRGSAAVSKLESAYEDVRQVREAKRKSPEILQAQQKLDASVKKEADARHALDNAEAKVRAIESELRELAPGRRLFRFLEDRSRTADYRQHLGLVSLVRRDFEQLSRLLRESEEFKEGDQPMLDRIVLYIDDLDRCRPDRVIQVLEAVHLLLAFPLFAVVVAVDPRWLRRSLLEHYPNLIGGRVNGTSKRVDEPSERQASPQDYLEKIFQVPFHLQCLEKDGFNELTSKLFSTKPSESRRLESRIATVPSGEKPASAEINPSQATPSPAVVNVGEASPKTLVIPPASQSPPVKQTPPPAPERLRLEPWEVSAVQRCQSLFRTPRAVKRLANTYCLIRVGIEAKEWDAFLGSEEQPGAHRTPLLLLAVCSAFPSIGRQWMNALKTSQSKSWIPTDEELPQITGPNVPATIIEQWEELRRGLQQMQAAKFVELDPVTAALWVARVERYSF